MDRRAHRGGRRGPGAARTPELPSDPGSGARFLRDARGRPLPPILFGTSAIGSVDPTGLWGRRERRRAFRLLDAVADAGCRAFDLARSYRAGGAERVVGEWLRHAGLRDRLFLASKGGHPIPLVAPRRLDTRALEADLNATLRALGIERLDLFLLHRDDARAPLDRIAADLSRFRRDGRARRTGVSNWTYERLARLDATAPGEVVHASSPQFSLAEWKAPAWSGCWSISGRKRRYERRQYARAGLPTLAYCPLGRGFLSAASERRRARGSVFRQAINVERRRRCGRLADRYGATTAQIALAYLLRQPFPVFPVVGVSSRAHMEANLAAARLALTRAELRWLEDGGPEPDEPPAPGDGAAP
jgi:aryl-alcohol dehydrogenase-like predicted oxidoreductase